MIPVERGAVVQMLAHRKVDGIDMITARFTRHDGSSYFFHLSFHDIINKRKMIGQRYFDDVPDGFGVTKECLRPLRHFEIAVEPTQMFTTVSFLVKLNLQDTAALSC
jgi:hypothetical protein